MEQQVPSPAEALAEIERTQRTAYARQRLPLWYVPAFLGAITLVGIGGELHGAARAAATVGGVLAIVAAAYAMGRGMRVRWKARTWTFAAGAEFGAWVLSILVVIALTGLVVGAVHYHPILQRVVIGLVAAAYSGATVRWIEGRVRARTSGKVVR
jgi:hypothetical protein